jgi:hypothetical protein
MLPWKLRAWIKVILNTKRERERKGILRNRITLLYKKKRIDLFMSIFSI